MSGDIQPYLDLVTLEHGDEPNFIATLSAFVQPIADVIAVVDSIPALFDLDVAAGVQLDTVGQWVGVGRQIAVPLTGVYFAWGTAGVGWGQGTWRGPFDPLTGLVSLPDGYYRTLIRARIANNQWDGTIPGAYAIWNSIFAATGFGILIQNTSVMHIVYALTGPVPDAVTLQLFEGGYLNVRPAGVEIDAFVTPAIPNTPYFGWGVQQGNIAGWGVGAWGIRGPGQ